MDLLYENKDHDKVEGQEKLSYGDERMPPHSFQTEAIRQQVFYSSSSSSEGVIAEAPCEDDLKDIDAKRVKRLLQRAQQRKTLKVNKTEKNRVGLVRKGSKRQPMSTFFSIDCGEEKRTEVKQSTDLTWYACKINLKGIA